MMASRWDAITHPPDDNSPTYPSDCSLLSASMAVEACRSVGVLPAGLATKPSTPSSVGESNSRSLPHASASAQNAGPALTEVVSVFRTTG